MRGSGVLRTEVRCSLRRVDILTMMSERVKKHECLVESDQVGSIICRKESIYEGQA